MPSSCQCLCVSGAGEEPCSIRALLTHAQLAEIVVDVQSILWRESGMLPDDARQYGDYWNPGKEDDGEGLEQIADILTDADLKRETDLHRDASSRRSSRSAKRTPGQCEGMRNGANRGERRGKSR
jgi:hypothetical protein